MISYNHERKAQKNPIRPLCLAGIPEYRFSGSLGVVDGPWLYRQTKGGFRIDFVFGQDTLHLHEPHPGKEIKPYQVKAVRVFLLNIGVKP